MFRKHTAALTNGGVIQRADYGVVAVQRVPSAQPSDGVGVDLESLKCRINANTGLFEKTICNCISPAMLLWILNCAAFAVHLSMGIVVLVEGGKNPDEMAFQITQVVGTWQNLSAREGYAWLVQDSGFGLVRLDILCATFAFISSGFHFLICCFSFWALSSCM